MNLFTIRGPKVINLSQLSFLRYMLRIVGHVYHVTLGSFQLILISTGFESFFQTFHPIYHKRDIICNKCYYYSKIGPAIGMHDHTQFYWKSFSIFPFISISIHLIKAKRGSTIYEHVLLSSSFSPKDTLTNTLFFFYLPVHQKNL